MGWFRQRPRSGLTLTTSVVVRSTPSRVPRWASMLTLGVLLGFVIVGLFSLSSSSSPAYPETTLLGFTFRFEGKDYNPATDESTWHYTVTGPASAAMYEDLQNWMLALCASGLTDSFKGVSGNGRVQTSADGQHGLVGIKWDDTVSTTGSSSFSFVLKGDRGVDMNTEVSIKAGPDFASGVLPGPGCHAAACTVDYEVTTLNNWRFMRPGEYAAPAYNLRLTGNTAARLLFSDFRDAVYVTDWTAAHPVQFEYSVGQTLDEADAFGWYSAAAFNDVVVTIPEHVVASGAELSVWTRTFISEAHRAAEYRGGGRFTVVPDCL